MSGVGALEGGVGAAGAQGWWPTTPGPKALYIGVWVMLSLPGLCLCGVSRRLGRTDALGPVAGAGRGLAMGEGDRRNTMGQLSAGCVNLA